MFKQLIEFCEKLSKLEFEAVVEGALALVFAAATIRYVLIPILFGH